MSAGGPGGLLLPVIDTELAVAPEQLCLGVLGLEQTVTVQVVMAEEVSVCRVVTKHRTASATQDPPGIRAFVEYEYEYEYGDDEGRTCCSVQRDGYGLGFQVGP